MYFNAKSSFCIEEKQKIHEKFCILYAYLQRNNRGGCTLTSPAKSFIVTLPAYNPP